MQSAFRVAVLLLLALILGQLSGLLDVRRAAASVAHWIGPARPEEGPAPTGSGGILDMRSDEALEQLNTEAQRAASAPR